MSRSFLPANTVRVHDARGCWWPIATRRARRTRLPTRAPRACASLRPATLSLPRFSLHGIRGSQPASAALPPVANAPPQKPQKKQINLGQLLQRNDQELSLKEKVHTPTPPPAPHAMDGAASPPSRAAAGVAAACEFLRHSSGGGRRGGRRGRRAAAEGLGGAIGAPATSDSQTETVRAAG